MRRPTIGMTGLALAASLLMIPTATRAADETPKALGKTPAYDALAKLPVLHAGRVKPFDTLAREEVKQIFGRETIKVVDPSQKNKVVETWGPVAAVYDWSVRPEVWDDVPFILVEYVPLKRLLLADSIRTRLGGIAGKEGVAQADKDSLKKLAADPEISAVKLDAFIAGSKLSGDDLKTVKTVAAELSEEHKWLTPRQIEEAKVAAEGGQVLPFDSWFREIVMKKRKADASPNGEVRLTDVEKRANEVGTRLVHYQALRDREMRSVEPLRVMPRPGNKEYLAYIAKISENARKTMSAEGLAPFELDAAKALDTYWTDLPIDDRAVPGTDEKFDKPFSEWLLTSSAWVPVKALLGTKPEELAAAGYPADKVKAFLDAFAELDKAEDAAPGNVAQAKAEALVAAARNLGQATSPQVYPSVAAVERETYFNETNPFFKAPVAYGLAVALLAVALGFQGFEKRSFLGGFGRVVYSLGVLGLVGGIALEAVGFYLRVRISGWAPVTNMYETVIWVSIVSAVLGLAFELKNRNCYAGLAGSMTALLGTVLAANVPLLDPDIHALQPVLRSNYWLTIHVLTEVSSYGAFLMAAMLGLIGTIYYLTATYRRSPSFAELALPLVAGLPLLGAGAIGVLGGYGEFGTSFNVSDTVFYLCVLILGIGEALCLTGVAAIGGEVVNRLTFRDDQGLIASAETERAEAAAMASQSAAAESKASAAAGGVATITKPTVAEIRAMGTGGLPKRDARGQAMHETASRIKPISNFIYRTMQVGVLLIAAGTILGGIWADYSWGRFWGWDPKEVWALITLLVYLVPLHGRFAGWITTFGLVFWSVVCSMSVIMAWYGVNFVLGVGLHSYGFTEGGGQGVVTSVCVAAIALPLGAYWRRRMASLPVTSVA